MEIVGQIVLTEVNSSSRLVGPACHKWYTGIIEEGRQHPAQVWCWRA
jgi:hypothetical protein